ncbi:MAG TPA: hypothetical protein VLJ39_18185 [Tepidisphaeraceae bacterium]|nr:hypothetical protein [Tepidisphaeraceae bacterium]
MRNTSVIQLLTGLAAVLILGAAAVPPSSKTSSPGAIPASEDPVARLQTRLDSGGARLGYEPGRGWLKSVLRELKVPAESQGLVFSKTSFQPTHISPRTPRAIYFNDDVYIGFVQGGSVLEVASIDPKNGTTFYALSQQKTDRPHFVRESASCLQCHQSQLTGDVPGLLMRSVYPDSDGQPIFSAGTFVTTEQSPFKERWGGWYMDGKMTDPGLGNAILLDADHPEQLTPTAPDLRDQMDLAPYLTPHSDPVALLVLAHQTHLHNLLARAASETKRAAEDDAILRKMLRLPADEHSDTFTLRLKSACDPVVQGLLFSGEAPISGKVEGSTNFAAQFEKQGPFDARGRSFRQFDLHQRLFKYPCSYLIYSEQFDALPDPAKQYVYRRLWQVLTGRDDSAAFSHLSDESREAIYQILCQTKAGLPAYWKARP